MVAAIIVLASVLISAVSLNPWRKKPGTDAATNMYDSSHDRLFCSNDLPA
jgi:hypothetical protein